MNILVIQLGRFGDIYQTWPVLAALKRVYPEASLNVLVRERFASALHGIEGINPIVLPTKDILEPILRDRGSEDIAIERMSKWLLRANDTRWDYIINLSFSPSSSFIVDLLSSANTVVSGYSRTSDGFLHMPDDASAYFYAQVGVGRSNRIHICDLFALVAAVDLQVEDFQFGPFVKSQFVANKGDYIVLHLGASQTHKRCSEEQWQNLIALLQEKTGTSLVLIGSREESILLKNTSRVVDLCGQTKIDDLLAIIAHAKLVIGADSVAIQVASLTNAPTLNISVESVNFWETGPRAENSRVLWFQDGQHINIEQVVNEACSMLQGLDSGGMFIKKEESFGVIYSLHGYQDNDWTWQLTRSLYMNSNARLPISPAVRLGLQSLLDLAMMGIEQVELVQREKTRAMAVSVLNEVDALVHQVLLRCPDLSPLVRWFQTEKSRIQPGTVQEVLATTSQVFEKLKVHCERLLLDDVFKTSETQEATWK